MPKKRPDAPPPSAADLAAEATHRSAERREFLRKAGVVGGLAASASYLSLAPRGWPLSLSDPDGEAGKPQPLRWTMPEGGYRAEGDPGAGRLGVARGADLPKMVRAALDGLGGVGRFIQKGDVVVIKPNVAFERTAALGATSNPEVVAALIEVCREAGAREVRVADNPIESPESCFQKSGIQRAAVEAGARVYLPSDGDFQVLNTPGAKWIENWPFFVRPFLGATKVIGVAPVKDHNLCRASMTTKNWYGLLGGRRNQFHQDIHGIIHDLARMMRPTFVLLDGSRVMFRSGPTGGSLDDVRPGHTLVAATDSLAADAFGWDDLLHRAPESRPAYFELARESGLGRPDWKTLDVREVQIG